MSTGSHRSDRTSHRYELIHGGGHLRSYADDLDVLLGELVPGHADAAPERRRGLRVAHAEAIEARLQARILVAFADEECDPAQQAALETVRTGPVLVERWRAPIPLVLLDTRYAPHTDVPRPVADGGEIVWLDTSGAREYLTSLARAGEVVLAEATEPGVLAEATEPGVLAEATEPGVGR